MRREPFDRAIIDSFDFYHADIEDEQQRLNHIPPESQQRSW